MYTILELNKISESGSSLLTKTDYSLVSKSENPDGVILRSFNMHEMELPPSLKAIARAGAGVNNIPVEKCSEKGIVVFNTPGANANAVKELVIAAILMSSRKIYQGINWAQTLKGQKGVEKLVEQGKADFVGPEIKGKKMGVIGLGAIGVLVANSCQALKMEVVGFDPFISIDAAWGLSRGVKKANTMEELYEQCDYISIHVPLNDKTNKMVNTESIKTMKDGIKILNFARGELVDNIAIKEALKDGKVSCYVTDFPSDEILGVENIITIPHLGASTPESEDNCAAMAALELKEFLECGNITNSVNFPNCELPCSCKKRICIVNRNVPNVIGSITTAVAEGGLNIENMLNKSKGDYSYTIIDINEDDLKDVPSKLLKLEGIINIRVI